MQKIKDALRNFMIGRHGADQLSLALLIVGLIVYLIAVITGLSFLTFIQMILYIWALFRMFSRNNVQRNAENQAYLNLWYKVKTAVAQFFNRMKNSGKYKYFKCPQCKCRLRLPRKVGEVTVTCQKCGNKFKKKA